MNPFRHTFKLKYLLTMIAIEHLIDRENGSATTYRVLRLFGFQIAWWSTVDFEL
jgi:hypothetical protein